MIKFYRFGGLLAALLLGSGAYAGDIQIENARTRATVPGQESAMVNLSITSKQAATLVGASSSASKTTALHTMTHKNGMMSMREVKSINLPANERVEMTEHGYHLELAGLKAPLKAGATVPLTLNIEMTDKSIVKVVVQVEVKPLKNAAHK